MATIARAASVLRADMYGGEKGVFIIYVGLVFPVPVRLDRIWNAPAFPRISIRVKKLHIRIDIIIHRVRTSPYSRKLQEKSLEFAGCNTVAGRAQDS